MAFDQLLRRFRKAAAALVGVAIGIGFAEAAAQSAFCRDVQADYLRAERNAGSGSGGRVDVGRLQRQLADAQNDARRAGCRRILFGKPGKNCPALMARVNQLQRDIGRARNGGGFGRVVNNSRSERDRLRGVLLRNGCEIPSRGGGMEYAGSGYRTLCVRTCDGYYFPISFSTSRSRFKIDEAVCKSMYGGEASELYVHHNGSRSDTAVSLTGQPIAASTNAFAYRHFYSPSCQAQLHRGLANLGTLFQSRIAEVQAASAPGPQAAGQSGAIMPTPSARPAPGLDPETLANLAGSFTVRPVRTPEEAAIVAASEPMRKLGPDYYYTTPIAIDAIRDPPQRGPVFSLIGTAHAGEVDDDGPGETSLQ